MTRISHQRMVDGLSKAVWSKQTWIDTFSVAERSRPARPSHEIEDARELLAVLRQAHADYSVALQRGTDRERAA